MSTFVPPESVARAAVKGLRIRASLSPSRRCCTSVGLKRASQLKNRQPLSIDIVRRMKAYFDRHQVDKKGRGWGVNSKGYQAWLLWGGDPGYRWAKSIMSRYRRNSDDDDDFDIEEHPAFKEAMKRRKALNKLLEEKPHPLVAPLLGDRLVVLVHKSTRKPGWWQATFFEGNEPIGDSESLSWKKLLEHIHMDSVDWERAKRARNSNSFEAIPKEFSGPVTGGVAEYPGFHTASEEPITYPYAQIKAVPDDLTTIYEGLDISDIILDDYPVVVTLDMSGLKYETDYDAVKMVKPSIVVVAQEAVRESRSNPIEALYEYIEMGNYGGDSRGTPTLAREWLFEYGSPVIQDPSSSLLAFAEEHNDPNEFLRALAEDDIPDDALAVITAQFRYTQDVSADRIVEVRYLRPWWPEILDELEEEDLISDLSSLGWSVVVMDDVHSWNLDVEETSVYSRKPKKGARIEYHGTSYLNVARAAPGLRLPRPPFPYKE